MYEELLKTLRDFTPFSIIVSAVVIFVVCLCHLFLCKARKTH